jgi:hypothetical protein
MSHRKTVTEKTLAANRLNAKRSTGPRTERGKNTSRFNAVKTGMFAEHLVIPKCDRCRYEDDEDPYEQFSKLLDALQHEYKPEGPSEVFCVAQLAECMWKQRRLSRSERGFVLATTEINSSVAINTLFNRLSYQISVLKGYLKWIETTRADSPEFCEASIPLVHLLTRINKISLGTENESSPDGVTLDQFVATLQRAKDDLESSFTYLIDPKMKADYDAARVLPQEDEMNQLLRYDRALQKKFDWALQRLLESQQRRRKAQAPASVQVSSEPSACTRRLDRSRRKR